MRQSRPRCRSQVRSAAARRAADPPWKKPRGNGCKWSKANVSGKVEEQQFRVLAAAEAKLTLAAHRRAVAGREPLAVQLERAPREVHPRAARRFEIKRNAFGAVGPRAIELRVLVEGHRTVAPAFGSEKREGPLGRVDLLLLIAGLDPAALGEQPDLQEVHRLFLGGVELAVHDAAAGAHALDLAGPDHAAAAARVLVLQGAREDVAQDLHVAVRVRAEALAGLHGVVVDHAQRGEALVLPVVVFAEREGVEAVQPADVGVKAVAGLAQGDHDVLRRGPRGFGSLAATLR